MIRVLSIVALLATAACASSTTAPVVDASARAPARVSAPTSAVIADPLAALQRVGQPNSLNTSQATAMLGPPDVDRRDGVGALLTWRLPSCALVLGFANDRLTSVEPGARATDAAPPSLQTCLDEARARRPAS